MSYDLETIFNVVGESVMLLNEKGKVTWIMEDEKGEKGRKEMDLAEYVMTSLGSTMIEKGETPDTIKKILDKRGMDFEYFPYHSVVFNGVGRGGKRRLTRRRRTRK
jgi:hypothetical protein